MKPEVPRGEQVIGDNPAMAPPPQSLGAHDPCDAPAAEVGQTVEPLLEPGGGWVRADGDLEHPGQVP